MSNSPLVSIHIITYNQIDFIHETLLSALEQDYENLEVVVADDGSTDGTAEVILEYAAQYPNRLVPLVGGPNLGITGNSNRGLKACKGKYIAFQGGDDVLLPGKITAQVAWMEEDEHRVLCGHSVEVFNDNSSFTPYIQKRKFLSGSGVSDFIRYGVCFQGTSIMIRRDAVPKDGFDQRLKHYSDDLFFTDIASRGHYGFIEGVYARYRKHGSNISNDYFAIRSEWKIMFDIFRWRYPEKIMDVKAGVALRIDYSEGVRLYREGKYREAKVVFVNIIVSFPQFWKAYVRLGQCLLRI